MDIKKVIGKIAYSKDGKKIGEIIDVKETMEKVLKHSKKYLLFQNHRFFMRPFKVAIELTDDEIIEEDKVILSITKQEFKEEVRKAEVARKHKAAQAKLQEASNETKASALSMPMGKV